MGNWVQEKAYAEANICQDACQLWNALKACIQEAVATWTTIYSQSGTKEIVVSSSGDNLHTAFTVTVTPVGAGREYGLEVAFDPSQNLIHVTPQPYKKTFHVYVDQAQGRVGLKQQDVPSSKDVLIEDACRLILEPLIEGLGHRRPIGTMDT